MESVTTAITTRNINLISLGRTAIREFAADLLSKVPNQLTYIIVSKKFDICNGDNQYELWVKKNSDCGSEFLIVKLIENGAKS